MRLLTPDWKDRLNHWIRVLTEDFYEPLGEIHWEVFHTMDHLTPQEVMDQTFVPVESNYTWGKQWEYCWFRSNIILPESAKGERIIMDLRTHGETTLFVNGREFGCCRIPGFTNPWLYFEDNVLADEAKGGEHFEVLMEAYAGHNHFVNWAYGKEHKGPVLKDSDLYENWWIEGQRRTMEPCTYGIFNEAAFQLYMDVSILKDLYELLDETSLRAIKVGKALKDFMKIVDFEQPREKRIASYLEAREKLKPVMEAHNGSTMQECFAVGQSHLDLAWLWPLAETHRKTARTFAAQLRLMEMYPEYRYMQSQPAAYEMCREHYPELFERIREAAKTGKWIPDGGMWVEADLNITGGESMIRQFVHGKRYFKEMFDVDSQVFWMLDTFGYSAALPQIMSGCGVKYFASSKLFGTPNDWDPLPERYFNWEGIDGSKVIASLCFCNNVDIPDVNKNWKQYAQPDTEALLLPFGYSDGGGGPSRTVIEGVLRQKDLEGSIKVHMSSPGEYFEYMEEVSPPEKTYYGELYYCQHRGTLTNQAAIKRNNRKGEMALREMEIWSSLAMDKGMTYDGAKADKMWKVLLLNQFHDILPGSSIQRVNEESVQQTSEMIAEAAGMSAEARDVLVKAGSAEARNALTGAGCAEAKSTLTDAGCADVRDSQAEAGSAEANEQVKTITIFNSLSFERNTLVVLPDVFADGAVTLDGTEVPVQKTVEGVKTIVKVPACGAVSLCAKKLCTKENSLAEEVNTKSEVIFSEDAQAEVTLADDANAKEAGALVETVKVEVTTAPKLVKVTAVDEGFCMENSKVLVKINKSGEIVGYQRKDTGREFLVSREGKLVKGNQFRLYKDVPRMNDAWDIDAYYKEEELPGAQNIKVTVVNDAGLEGVLKVTGTIANSSYTQYIRLAADSDRVVFDTEVDWDEIHKLLKVEFVSDVYAQNAFNEIQYGYLERPTHGSRIADRDRFEVCNYRYTALCDGSHGVAVLNDCKYGISMEGSALALTLLRGAVFPQPHSDKGVHQFTYAFTGWDGTFMESDVVRQAYELNVDPQLTAGELETFSALSIDKANIFMEAMKPAEDGSGDIVLRLYEAKKASVTVQISSTLFQSRKVYVCDMLENIQEEVAVEDGVIKLPFRPFEIKTVRLTK